jgi:hypothetical protein
MPESDDDVERIITAAVWPHSKSDPAALARVILEDLWEAGYEVTARHDVIPIRRHSEQ